MTTTVDKIDGIGPVYRSKLEAAGIATTDSLLEQCGSREGRRRVASLTGLREAQLLKWVNCADLMRLRGIGKEYSQLLEAAGVDTVRELKMRNPDMLHAKLTEVNANKHLARRSPALHDVTSWVTAASAMEPRVFH